LIEQSLSVLGIARDCGPHLPAVFRNLETIRPLFNEFRVFLIESDSIDDTADCIRSYRRSCQGINARFLNGLDKQVPLRTERLAHLRNAALEWLRSVGGLNVDGLVMVLDLDEVNVEAWDIFSWQKVLSWFSKSKDSAAVFANQIGPYYDLWALRHPQRCPGDIWQYVFDLHCSQPTLSDQELISKAYKPRMFALSPQSPPEQVDSAFGGLGFYKTCWLRRNVATYCGLKSRWLYDSEGEINLVRWHVSEHVSFHLGLRAMGANLWIHPQLINWTTAKLPDLRPNPKAWRYMRA